MPGLLGSLLARAAHALVDFNWQIPANAATCGGARGAGDAAAPTARGLDPPDRRA